MAAKNLFMLIGATVAMSALASVNGPGVDITAFVRNSGTGNYTVEAGSDTKVLNGCPIANAFDGDSTSQTESARVMLQNANGSPTPTRVLYSISDSAFPGYDFTVTSFTIYRQAGVYNSLERSATGFKLEGFDGRSWQPLFETSAATAWDWNTFSRTYTIPPVNRASYRKYLFTITANGGDTGWSGFLELVFTGNITPGLVWNGATGATWDASSANWIDGIGTATNWIPGANAVFGSVGAKAVSVVGGISVGDVEFPESGESYSFSGGTLLFPLASKIVGGNGDVIGCAVTGVVMSVDHVGWLPSDPANTTQGAYVRLWKNRRLADITGFSSAKLYYSGGEYSATPCHFTSGETVATCQFQVMPSPLLCVKVQFEQSGNDIWAKAIYGKYSWASDRAIGKDFDSYGSELGIYDGDVSTSGYGLKDIVAVGGDDTVPTLDFELGCDGLNGVYGDDWLPADASNAKQGTSVKMWENRSVADITGFNPATMWFNSYGETLTVSPYFYTNNGTVASCQYQAKSNLREVGLCLKVQFEQVGSDIYARIVYSKSKWASDALGQNYDSYGDINYVYDGVRNTGGLGIKNITADFNGKMSLNGSSDVAISVNGGALTLGASAIALDRAITGNGTVRFAPSSGSQTVTVPVARTLGNVAFGGATSFTFAKGASLSVAFAEIEDSASVSVSGANLLRIGTSKLLSKEECAHFTVNGSPAMQDDDGWLVPKPGLIILVK